MGGSSLWKGPPRISLRGRGVSPSPPVVTKLRSAGHPSVVSRQIGGGQDRVRDPVASVWTLGRVDRQAGPPRHPAASPLHPQEGSLTPWLPERTWV